MVWTAMDHGGMTPMSSVASLKERLRTALIRIRYPRSMPEDIAAALGISSDQPVDWQQVLSHLQGSGWAPPRLHRLMARVHAEAAFSSALQIEEFTHTALCSYHLAGGWLTFDLHFDLDQRLRRLYVRHPSLGGEPRELSLR